MRLLYYTNYCSDTVNHGFHYIWVGEGTERGDLS